MTTLCRCRHCSTTLQRWPQPGPGYCHQWPLLGNIVWILGAKFYNFGLYYTHKLFWKFNLKCIYMISQHLSIFTDTHHLSPASVSGVLCPGEWTSGDVSNGARWDSGDTIIITTENLSLTIRTLVEIFTPVLNIFLKYWLLRTYWNYYSSYSSLFWRSLLISHVKFNIMHRNRQRQKGIPDWVCKFSRK